MTPEKVVIGNCELWHGDCLEILPTLGKVDAVVTDPPYGMSFVSNHRKSKHKQIENDGTPSLLYWTCRIKAEHSKYIFCRWDNLADVEKPNSCITWVKNNWSMGDLRHEHARQTESILFYRGKSHLFPNGRPADILIAQKTANNDHPTQKPVYLMENIVGWTIGTVFDPFMGSGTTGVACVNLGRKFVGIEIERKYFDIACKLIEQAYAQIPLFEPEPMREPEQLSI